MPNLLQMAQTMAVGALPILLAFTVSAIAMVQAAWALGDRSQAMRERLSLNPLKHVDPLMTLVIPLLLIATGGFVFGGPKMVPLNPAAFRQPRKDLALVAMAGVGANFAMAFAWAFVLKLAVLHEPEAGFWLGLAVTCLAGVTVNVGFGLFQLLPIPGFTGGHIVGAVLPRELAPRWYALQAYSMIILLLLVVTQVLGTVLTGPMMAMRSFVLGVAGIEL